MPTITEGVEFTNVAREWRMKWTEDGDKKSLAEVQKVLDAKIAAVKAVAGTCDECLFCVATCPTHNTIYSLSLSLSLSLPHSAAPTLVLSSFSLAGSLVFPAAFTVKSVLSASGGVVVVVVVVVCTLDNPSHFPNDAIIWMTCVPAHVLNFPPESRSPHNHPHQV